MFLSGRIKQQMFGSLCGWATSFVNSDLPININGNDNNERRNPNEYFVSPWTSLLLLFANPGDVAAREHTQKRALCKKYASCCNKKPKQTIDGSGNCKVGSSAEKKWTLSHFRQQSTWRMFAAPFYAKLQLQKKNNRLMDCSYFCHSFVLLCHLCKESNYFAYP